MTLTHCGEEGPSLLRAEPDGILGAGPDNTSVLSGGGSKGLSSNLEMGGQMVEANDPPGLSSQSMVSL